LNAEEAVKILAEHEVAFDTQTVGFPSLDGCLGLVYQTTRGLFGYHIYGGNNSSAGDRATLFAAFVDSHGTGQQGTRLYGVCFVGKRGWLPSDGFSKDKKQAWKQELAIYAAALGYTGKVSGYDLSKKYAAASAYAEFRRVGDKSELWVRKWEDAVDRPEAKKSSQPNPNRADHVKIVKRSAGVVKEDLLQVYTSVRANQLVNVSKEKLKG